MKIKLIRKWKTDKSTLGELFVDGEHFSWTLELPWKDNEHDVSCIPTGTYDIKIVFSQHFQKKVPELQNVPDREEIYIHNGSYPKDTLGCILVGFTKAEDFISDSKMAFGALLVRIALAVTKEEDVSIEITEE